MYMYINSLLKEMYMHILVVVLEIKNGVNLFFFLKTTGVSYALVLLVKKVKTGVILFVPV